MAPGKGGFCDWGEAMVCPPEGGLSLLSSAWMATEEPPELKAAPVPKLWTHSLSEQRVPPGQKVSPSVQNARHMGCSER